MGSSEHGYARCPIFPDPCHIRGLLCAEERSGEGNKDKMVEYVTRGEGAAHIYGAGHRGADAPSLRPADLAPLRATDDGRRGGAARDCVGQESMRFARNREGRGRNYVVVEGAEGFKRLSRENLMEW